jgi:hypothetical protein
MANLDKSNVVNGNIISASDISALYDAFTGDTTYNNIDFTGTASNANVIKYTSLSTNQFYPVPFIITASSDYSQLYKDTADNILYNPSSNLLQTTASLAVTASYVASTEQSDTVVVNINTTGNRKGYAFAGVSLGGAVVDLTSAHVGLPVPTALGTDLTVTANDASTPGVPNTIGISYSAPTITFTNAGGADVVYQGWVWL